MHLLVLRKKKALQCLPGKMGRSPNGPLLGQMPLTMQSNRKLICSPSADARRKTPAPVNKRSSLAYQPILKKRPNTLSFLFNYFFVGSAVIFLVYMLFKCFFLMLCCLNLRHSLTCLTSQLHPVCNKPPSPCSIITSPI